jgi:ParB family chromosome partitioning protein
MVRMVPDPSKYDSVYWVEVNRIEPNPYQPRREFDETALKSLAESIRQYGILQPLTVTRKEVEKPDGGIQSLYELIAGERRLRASKLIGLKEVPVVIRQGQETDKVKLELAIIENLQREDLNAIDRGKAFQQLVAEFGLNHVEVAAKVGKSREYVSNSIRLLALPEKIQQALINKEISEGHGRALLMVNDRPQEQDTLFKELILKKSSVRVVEQWVRRIAVDKQRKHDKTPEMMELEKSLTETLGTRVFIENRPKGGRVLIEFFSPEDLSHIASILAERREAEARMSREAQAAVASVVEGLEEGEANPGGRGGMPVHPNTTQLDEVSEEAIASHSEPEDVSQDDDLYSVSSFVV